MKQTRLLAVAACTMAAMLAPSLKQQLHAESYCEVEPPVEQELGNPVYEIQGALIQETVKIAGCAAIPKNTFNNNVVFYDSGIAEIDYSSDLTLQASWAQVKNGVINISLTPESEYALSNLYSTKGLVACQSKFPAATVDGSGVVEPSVLTTASSFKVKGAAQMATGQLQMKGLYLNDGKKDKAGKSTAANLTVKLTIKGQLSDKTL